MATLQELQSERDTLQARMGELDAAAQDEGRDPTEAEDTEGETALARCEEITAEIEQNKQDAQASGARAAKAIQRADRLRQMNQTASGQGMTGHGVAQPGANTPRVTHYHENIDEDPKGGFPSLTSFLGHVNGTPDVRRSPDDKMRAYLAKGKRVGDQLIAEGGIEATAGSDEQSYFSDRYGGVLVPDEWRPTLLQLPPEEDPIGARTTKIPMAGVVLEIPARVDKTHTDSVSGGLTVRRVAEGDQGTISRMSFETVRLELYDLVGLTYATNKILTFSPMSFTALLQRGFGDEMTSHMIGERLNGTGVGEHLGIRQAGCLITVAKESEQVADTITYNNVIQMRSQAWRYGRSIWLANHDTLPELMTLEAVVGVGGSRVWQPSAVPDHPDTLLGRPIIFSEYMETLGDEGDLMLTDWAEYIEGQRGGIDAASSVHVRFLNAETTFRFSMMNAGTPWWRTALTPKKSSTELGPFITLAERA